MIVNLVGPPASGKSTFAARFVLEHPKFKYLPIDEYRIEYQDELIAWSELSNDAHSSRNIVLESCGLGWRLAELLNLPTMRRRPLITLAFVGDPEVLHDRLTERQKRPLPFPFLPEDEHLAIDHVSEHLFRDVVSPIDKVLDTVKSDRGMVYTEATQLINMKLLLREQGFRRNSFQGFGNDDPDNWSQISRVTAL